VRRRKFISLLGAAAAIPLSSHAQQGDRIRRIGVLHGLAADDPIAQARVAAFRQALQQLAWNEGRNLQIDYRWSGANAADARKFAAELVALSPDVILTNSAAVLAPLLEKTKSVPIVFVLVADPVGAGFVESMARPGGNATGFTALEYGLGGKFLELLKEIAPGTNRAAVIRDPLTTVGIGLFGAIQNAAPSLGIEVRPVNVSDAGEIERAISGFARTPNGGLVVTASPAAFAHRDLLITLAARHKLPAIFPTREFIVNGGLFAYGPDGLDQYRRAAGYVDRILRGEKPADLPVQAPTKYELVINLKTAKTLGLTVPPTLLSRANEVIE
jgi:putative tryptophan/tyrosine transport system substrate-binding protein